MLGHRRHWATAGYAHLNDGYLVEVAEKESDCMNGFEQIAADVEPNSLGP